MIYFVSGFMRSGTSMMMQALVAGGMTALVAKERDVRLNAMFGEPDVPNGYKPNSAYYEIEDDEFADPGFLQRADGKLVKWLTRVSKRSLDNVNTGEFRAIVMRRRREEIALSSVAAFRVAHPDLSRPDFDQRMDAFVARLRDRRSFKSVDEIWFDDVLAQPLAIFRRLGWPIDAAAAAAIPTHSKKRITT